ncbi:hypothetical protein [Flavobacterium sp.]|uniref:hypothetical protein n=1 Tax=Flavobacterium sp. TaxID=239 RepID=UPI00374D79D9
MRTIKFDSKEQNVLQEIILLGNSQYDNDFPEISKLILSKIRIEIFHFPKKEIQVLRSYCANWMNNNDELIDKLRKKYLDKNNIDYENISEVEIESMQKINIVLSIKSKLFSKNYITFKNVLDKINKEL